MLITEADRNKVFEVLELEEEQGASFNWIVDDTGLDFAMVRRIIAEGIESGDIIVAYKNYFGRSIYKSIRPSIKRETK